MPAEILLLAKATPTLPKGAIISVQPSGWIWGDDDGLPNFVQVTITDATKAEINRFLQRWSRAPLLTVESRVGSTVTLKLTNDGVVRSDGKGGFARALNSLDRAWQPDKKYVLNAEVLPIIPNGVQYKATTAGQSGVDEPVWPLVGSTVTDGSLVWTGVELSTIENRINEWNGTITDDSTPGESLFTVSSFGIVTSNLFWNANISSIIFTDLGLAGGIQQISADYSATAVSANVVSQRVITNRGEVISNDGSVIVFEFDTDDIKHYFHDSMQEFSGLIAKRRYRFRSVAVDAVIANGGHMNTDKATALANILDAAA